MNLITVIVFVIYFLAVLLIGLFSAGKKQDTAEDYFLAGRKLPWYAIGLSMVGSNISTEHFIGMVGAAYLYGLSPANWDLTSFIPLSILIFFFLPYYLRAKLFTIPQYLEQRYNQYTRVIFAGLTTVHMTLVLLAGSLYAGGLIFQELFVPAQVTLTESGQISSSLLWGIGIVAITTGIYSVYGGLASVVWTDVFQVVLLLVAGALVVIFATREAGGLAQVWETNLAANAQRVRLIQPANDPFAPWTGIATLWFTMGIWYNCTNQFYIQRCFGAKDEWNARMGVLLTAFVKMLMPLLTVLPGLIAMTIYGQGVREDRVFMSLVQDFLPPVLVALVLTGMAAAIMSTVSSVLNSSSTIYTIDIYERFLNRTPTQAQLVRVGRISTVVILLIGIVWAPFILLFGQGLFVYIQEMAGFFAPPIAVLFIMAALWKKANALAANTTLIAGFAFGIAMKAVVSTQDLPDDSLLIPFLNRALLSFIFSIGLFTLIALASKLKKVPLVGIIWKPAYAQLPANERQKYRGWKNFLLWWCVVLVLRLAIYVWLW